MEKQTIKITMKGKINGTGQMFNLNYLCNSNVHIEHIITNDGRSETNKKII